MQPPHLRLRFAQVRAVCAEGDMNTHRTKSLQLLLVLAIAVGSLIAVRLFAQEDFYLNADMPWHKAVLDSQGRILAWYHPEKNLGYDEFMRLDWDFLEHKVPIEQKAGVKVYLVAPTYDSVTLQGLSWQHNPAGTYAHLMDMLVGWYPYWETRIPSG